MCYVHTLNVCHYAVHDFSVIYCLEVYTSYGDGNMYDKFHGCTDDVQATTCFYNNPRPNPQLNIHA